MDPTGQGSTTAIRTTERILSRKQCAGAVFARVRQSMTPGRSRTCSSWTAQHIEGSLASSAGLKPASCPVGHRIIVVLIAVSATPAVHFPRVFATVSTNHSMRSVFHCMSPATEMLSSAEIAFDETSHPGRRHIEVDGP